MPKAGRSRDAKGVAKPLGESLTPLPMPSSSGWRDANHGFCLQRQKKKKKIKPFSFPWSLATTAYKMTNGSQLGL